MKIAGVVVFYNPTEKMISNIASYINDLEKLYIVDNSNFDNSELIPKSKKIVYLPNNKNLGIAAALNIGAKKAIKEKYDWLLTMDQDSKFENNAVKIILDYIKTKISNDGDFTKKTGIVTAFHDVGVASNIMETEEDNPLMVMTSGNFINLKAYKKINGFKSELFIDTVDFDFCLNLRIHGYEIVRLKKARLIHNLGDLVYGSLFGRKMYSSNHSAVRRYYQVRNRHYIYDWYHEKYPEYCEAEIKRTKRELVKIWGCEKHRIKKTIYMIKGYFDYKRGITGSYEDRKNNTKDL